MKVCKWKKAVRRFARFHFPFLFYCAAILVISSTPDLNIPGPKVPGIDKVVHFLEYTFFALLAFRSLRDLAAGVAKPRIFWYTTVVLLLFALIDESVQRFTPCRQPDAFDYLADLVGGLVMLTILWFRHSRRASSGIAKES